MNLTFLSEVVNQKHLNKLLFSLILFIWVFTSNCNAQKSFSGMLEYKISSRDTLLRNILPDNSMILYMNDTLVRMENFTGQFGQQITIRHIPKNKSYLLLETRLGKFAIQTDHTITDTSSIESKYHFKKKMFKIKYLGKKVNRMLVSHPDFEEPIEFLYDKKISKKYLNIFDEMPGLPVKYSIPTADGILNYELVKISPYTPNIDLFGIPSEYERLSFNDFLDRMLSPENEQIISPE